MLHVQDSFFANGEIYLFFSWKVADFTSTRQSAVEAISGITPLSLFSVEEVLHGLSYFLVFNLFCTVLVGLVVMTTGIISLHPWCLPTLFWAELMVEGCIFNFFIVDVTATSPYWLGAVPAFHSPCLFRIKTVRSIWHDICYNCPAQLQRQHVATVNWWHTSIWIKQRERWTNDPTWKWEKKCCLPVEWWSVRWQKDVIPKILIYSRCW